jgi:hypothetical protein
MRDLLDLLRLERLVLKLALFGHVVFTIIAVGQVITSSPCLILRGVIGLAALVRHLP